MSRKFKDGGRDDSRAKSRSSARITENYHVRRAVNSEKAKEALKRVPLENIIAVSGKNKQVLPKAPMIKPETGLVDYARKCLVLGTGVSLATTGMAFAGADNGIYVGDHTNNSPMIEAMLDAGASPHVLQAIPGFPGAYQTYQLKLSNDPIAQMTAIMLVEINNTLGKEILVQRKDFLVQELKRTSKSRLLKNPKRSFRLMVKAN